jgi:acetyl-CoA carboxylase, biotin carboxylase subunit
MIKKLLVANRAEIAVRVMRSAKEMGIKTVAVYSEVDRTALHVRYADEAYYIGPAPSNQSYLVMENILQVAKACGADAIHPGYGFLSENALFAKRCAEEGIAFIGPSPEAINAMGDKLRARQAMIAAGVPVVPGTTEGIKSEAEAMKVAEEIGFPIMVKASAGGGGKGMRLVKKKSELASAIRASKSEAKSAFGDDTVYMEKYIESPHHIEFQVLADKHGNTIHLFERECSVQRRHQKVVEETPSPLLTASLRAEMGEKAIAAAKAVGYYGAGTIEFIVSDDLSYYFLEMNTRLQVEHPITERVTGKDLVKEQIRIANGEVLSFGLNDIRQFGHAIECRIYAEDPTNGFMPSPGIIKHLSEPLGTGVRHDGYVYEGYEIPIYYDPMISKLIVWGQDREEAIERMRSALHSYKITGVKTNLRFLERIMECGDFKLGKYNTHFIEMHLNQLLTNPELDIESEDVAIMTVFIDYLNAIENAGPTKPLGTRGNLWKEYGRRRSLLRL